MTPDQEQAAALLASCRRRLCGPGIECAERVADGNHLEAESAMWTQLKTEHSREIADQLNRMEVAR
jgi:hypothetical protein